MSFSSSSQEFFKAGMPFSVLNPEVVVVLCGWVTAISLKNEIGFQRFRGLVKTRILLVALFLTAKAVIEQDPASSRDSLWIDVPLACFVYGIESCNLKSKGPILLAFWSLLLLQAHFIGGTGWADQAHSLTQLTLVAVDVLPWFEVKGDIPTLSAIYSNALLTWLNPMIFNAHKKNALTLDDIPRDKFHLNTKSSSIALQAQLSKETVFSGRKVLSALIYATLPKFSTYTLLSLLRRSSGLVRPFLVRQLVLYVQEKKSELAIKTSYGYIICLAIFGNSACSYLLEYHQSIKEKEFTAAVSSSLESTLYQKLLRLSRKGRESYSTAKINEVMVTDVLRLKSAAIYSKEILVAPTELILSFVFLWDLMGRTSLVGVIPLIAFIPLNTKVLSLITGSIKRLRIQRRRVSQLVNDLFANMKLVKLFAWEDILVKQILVARESGEVPAHREQVTRNRFANLIWSLMPFLVSFVTLSSYTYFQKKPLTADIIFPTLSLVKTLHNTVIKVPKVFTQIENAQVSATSIADFLNAEELGSSRDTNDSQYAVDIDSATFFWEESADHIKDKVALNNITFRVKKGDFVCLIGRVGSGKSSLLSTILGELECTPVGNKIIVNGSIAYVSQEPWIRNGTFRENILLGLEYKKEFYEDVLAACQLDQDVASFAKKDFSIVGEKGISLSGGQRARLSLARAIYSAADIYLIDDVLSSVDNQVSTQLIDEVLSKHGILAGKTVILATNNMPILAHSNEVVLLENGAITARGSLANVKNSESFHKIEEYLSGQELVIKSEPEASFTQPREPPSLGTEVPDILKKNFEKYSSIVTARKSQASLPSSTYLEYAKACSQQAIVVVVTLSLFSTVLSVSTDLWLKRWAEDKSFFIGTMQHYIAGYALIGLSSEFVYAIRTWFLMAKMGLGAGSVVFERMTRGLAGSSIRFFEKTPLGVITSRYSKDMIAVDGTIPSQLFRFIMHLSSAVVTVSVLIHTSPSVIPILGVVVLAFSYYRSIHTVAANELKVLDGVSQASFLSLVHETTSGLETIRAYRRSDYFLQSYHSNEDYDWQISLLKASLEWWLTIRLQLLTSTVILITSLSFVRNSGPQGVSGATVGFAMNHALAALVSFKNLYTLSVTLSAGFVAFERCLEFAKLDPEDTATHKKSAQVTGDIVFEDLSVTYEKDADLVLRNINILIKSGEKIGVVGRTGAGKSSFLLALFRMLIKTRGSITIGGNDIDDLKLSDLRRSFAIIPQETHLFLGTVRSNLDPFSEYSDEKIWQALEDAHIKEHVESLENGFQSKVGESGSNFSGGQKQLLCLARALLRETQLLVMDEATASVDPATDKLIQEILRTKTSDKTVITIAHRVETILDSDRILGLEDGTVKEFDAPGTLLKDPSSLFYKLVNASK